MNVSISKQLEIGKGAFVSVIGAGGKSTLLRHIAYECLQQGLKVLTSSTTNMQPPPAEATDAFIVRNADEDICARLRMSFETCRHVTVAGASVPADASTTENRRDKIKGFEPDEMDAIYDSGIADVVLIQADGARRRSFKAPAEHEPRIPQMTTHCIQAIGLDVLGQPLDDVKVHRYEVTARLAGQTVGSPVSIDTILRVTQHADGYLPRIPEMARRILYLSKADSPERVEAAELIRAGMDPAKYETVIWADLKED